MDDKALEQQVGQIVQSELQKFLLKIATDAETISREHPEITLAQFAASIRVSAANVSENWEIEKFVDKI